MHEIIFSGTGAAWGIPELGCDCPACGEARKIPKWHRTRTSLIIMSDVNILIDPTPDLRQQLLNHTISRIDGIIITHAHLDHFAGLDEFRARRRDIPMFSNVPVFVGRGAWEKRISCLFSYLVKGESPWLRLEQLLEPSSVFSIGEWTIRCFPTHHGSSETIGPTFGFVFTSGKYKIIYTGDCAAILEQDEDLFKSADLFIADSTWLFQRDREYEIAAGHMSFERGYREYFHRFSPKRLALVHISHDEGRVSKEWRKGIRAIVGSTESPIGKIFLTFDGLRLPLD